VVSFGWADVEDTEITNDHTRHIVHIWLRTLLAVQGMEAPAAMVISTTIDNLTILVEFAFRPAAV